MTLLVIEPLPERGIRISVSDKQGFLFSKQLEHGQDIVVAIDAAQKKFKKYNGIMIRSHVGSFSASRSALVAGNILSALHQVPLYITELPLNTPEEIMKALEHTKKAFSYERDPHITQPKKHA